MRLVRGSVIIAAVLVCSGTSGSSLGAQGDLDWAAHDHDITLVDDRAAPANLAETLAELVKKHRVPAMSAAVVKGARVIAVGASGVRIAGGSAAVTIDDRWHLGSDTKAMTATLCAILVERGTLTWETTLAQALPDLAAQMHEHYRGATLAQLCTNRAGVPGDLSAGGLWRRLCRAEGTPTQQRRMLVEGVLTREPASPPGTKYQYSNAGFAIAGYLCETAAGKPYEELMEEMLFQPLGMTTCGWGAPGRPGQSDQPRGHTREGEGCEPDPASPSGVGADNPIAISPAGRLHCTIGDWARFVAMHVRGHARNPHRQCRLLKPESFDRLHTPPDDLDGYAGGWARTQRAWAGPEGDRWVLTHAGSNTMWFCVVWIAPAKDFAVLVCCNQAERGDRACDEAAGDLIRRFADRD